jgi:hypothetical protein
VNKTKMRQALDRLKKTLGNDEDSKHSFQLKETDEHKQKPEAVPSKPMPLVAPQLPTVPLNLKIQG